MFKQEANYKDISKHNEVAMPQDPSRFEGKQETLSLSNNGMSSTTT